MLSNTCKYAIRAVIYIALNAESDNKIGIKKISKELDIPSPFLSKILQTLVKHKVLSSTKGPNGGFGISSDTNKVTLNEIVNIIDGSDLFEKCIISLRTCKDEGMPCPMHGKYDKIRTQLYNLFNNQTIAGLIADMNKSGKKIFI
ncbi:MAG: Rrf2 family transcriptional regulator [Bacteroidales bacterium]